MDLKNKIIEVSNFPKEGIGFKDITSVLADADALQFAIEECYNEVKDLDFDVIVGPESRGFIFGMPLAYKMNKPFIPVRKPGKLPRDVVSISYDLEYGSNTLEIHKDDIPAGKKALIIDDLLATSGTVIATIELLKQMNIEISCCLFFIELSFLNGRDKLKGYNVKSVVKY